MDDSNTKNKGVESPHVDQSPIETHPTSASPSTALSSQHEPAGGTMAIQPTPSSPTATNPQNLGTYTSSVPAAGSLEVLKDTNTKQEPAGDVVANQSTASSPTAPNPGLSATGFFKMLKDVTNITNSEKAKASKTDPSDVSFSSTQATTGPENAPQDFKQEIAPSLDNSPLSGTSNQLPKMGTRNFTAGLPPSRSLPRSLSGNLPSSRSNPTLSKGPLQHNNRPPLRNRPRPAIRYPPTSTFASAGFILQQVPSHVTTLDIENAFKNFCEVLSIDIWLDNMGGRNGKARVVVQPTSDDKWKLLITFSRLTLSTTEKGEVSVPVEVDRNSFRLHDEKIKSPLGKPIPRKMELKLQALHFGTLVQPHELLEMKTIEAASPSNKSDIGSLKVVVNFQIKVLQIFFPIESLDAKHNVTTFKTKVEIRFARFSVIKRYEAKKRKDEYLIVFALEHPPDYWRKMENSQPSHQRDRLRWNENDLWVRQTNCVWDPYAVKHAEISLNTTRVPQIVELGRWTALAVQVDKEMACRWMMVEQHLHDYNIDGRVSTEDFTLHRGQPPVLWSLLDFDLNHIQSSSSVLSLLSTHIPLSFTVRYQLEVCISRNMFNEHQIDESFLRTLSDMAEEDAKRMLEFVADRGTRVWNPTDIFRDTNARLYYPPQAPLYLDYCVLVRKAVVTPTTIYYSTPTVETNNRVLREFKNHQDRFLRVQFTDEIPAGRINYSGDGAKNDDVFTRIFRTLKNGICIGDRHYKFLAFGNSQLRENGAYFFADTADLTCDKIRAWMGNFDHIKYVAKYAARMGQCFSTTRLIPGMGTPIVKEINDVERNGFCFTDGVGKISEVWAEMIANHLKRNEISSVFQFRLGGCKGVLTVWPNMPDIRSVQIRPSQKKFEGTVARGLEIIKCSSYSVGTLNQQSILILSSLGVPNAIFMNLLREHIDKINTAMNDEKVAIEELRKRVDENEITLRIADMIFNGFMRANEPFVWTLLQLWRSWSLKALKHKARIEVPESAFVLGCVDETNTLRGHSAETEENGPARYDRKKLPQIFLQVPVKADSVTGSYKDRPEYRVITGLCIVGRNPALHPGDIRVVEAVDVPALHHIKNAVVFPMQGDRDIPSMCSGGDLDGDDFFVFWNQALLPPEWNYPPMHDVGVTPERKDQVEIDHLIAFFVIYMKNDSLPQIALSHKAQADFLGGGVKNTTCLELARLHSQAVDYVKSGVKVSMPQYLQARSWPHFMEKKRKKRHSHGILGQIYDKVKTADFQPIYDLPFDERILSRYRDMPNGNDLMRTARRIKTQYDTNMRRVLGQQEIATEFEIWTGFALSKRRVGSDYKMTEEIGKEYRQLRTRFRDQIISGPCGNSKEPEVLWPFVAAMYRVTQEEVKIALHECKLKHSVVEGGISDAGDWKDTINPKTMPLISFPWLFDDVLGKITKDNGPLVTKETDDDDDNKNSDEQKLVRDLVAPTAEPALQASTEACNGPAQLVNGVENLKVTPVKPAYGDLTEAEMAEMQYVRHPEGYITHRGEAITLLGVHVDLFGLPNDKEDEKAVPSQPATEFETETEQSELEPLITEEDGDGEEGDALFNNPLFKEE